ncbi:hypothetical protein Anas_10756 [Armadillidium nasatum]|uniref:Uncharacterized protein n=1 Tax=Armadillidium nasatum TaxID=96803 RepID=A0A5N5SVX9_9CRUS|nr:hypothetical protein Anas_10756 [Armadillidium nasatum]
MGIVEALASRGHQVTVVSGYAESTKKNNIRDVLIKDLDIDSIVSTSFESPGNAIKNLLLNSPQMCSDTLGQKDVQDLKKEKFDIVMISVFFNYCYLSLVDHFNVPFVYLSSGGLFSPFTDMANNVDFPSVFSSKVLGASFPLSFKERLLNTFYNGFFWGVFKFYLMPRTEKICKERGLCSENLSLFDLGNNSSLTIINSFKTLEVPPRPVIPNIIYAGGAHIKPAKGVPKDLESWIAGSGNEGFIFFSLGSTLNPSILPERYRKILVKVFGSLKQRILWKWSEEINARFGPKM